MNREEIEEELLKFWRNSGEDEPSYISDDVINLCYSFSEHIAKLAVVEVDKKYASSIKDLDGCVERRDLVIQSIEKERDALQAKVEFLNKALSDKREEHNLTIRKLAKQATDAEKERDVLMKENFELSARQCCVNNGLLGDDFGNQYCGLKAKIMMKSWD